MVESCLQHLWKSRFLLVASLLGLYWMTCFTLTHMPMPHRGNAMATFPHLDKVVHFTMFFGLTFLLTWFFVEMGKGYRKGVIAALLIAMTYGAIDEISQGWVSRTTDVFDWMADSAGAITGVLLVVATRLYFLSKQVAHLSLARSSD